MKKNAVPFPSIKDVPASNLEKLSQKKIYFGHQSVGFNIIDGIRDVMKENRQIKLNIIETANPADFNTGVFAHSTVGKNRDSKSKIDEFVTIMDNGVGDKADISALKFCYVDITADSDVVTVIKDYEIAISNLKLKYPKMTIIHFTIPLRTLQTGPKAWVKKLIGRSIGAEENIKRNEYNEQLLNIYKGIEPVFDLAAIESTAPDGNRAGFVRNGKSYYILVPEFTDDGGHLNEFGRKIVAEQLLIFLSNLEKN